MTTWTAPITWADGDATQTVAAVFNPQIRDNELFLYGAHGARAYRNAGAYSFTSGTPVTSSFDTEDYDTDNYFAPAASIMTIPAGLGGIYVVTAGVTFASNATGVRLVNFLKNAAVVRAPSIGTGSGTGISAVFSIQMKLAATDTVSVQGFQNSGSTLAATLGSAYNFLEIAYLGNA